MNYQELQKATQRKVGDMDFYYTENEYETAKKYGKTITFMKFMKS